MVAGSVVARSVRQSSVSCCFIPRFSADFSKDNLKWGENPDLEVKKSSLKKQNVQELQSHRYQEASYIMAVSELPVSITEPKPHTSYDYFAHKYGHKTVVQYKEELKAIDTSLHAMGSPKRRRKQTRRHKKAKFPSMSIVPDLEDISESEETNSLEGEYKTKKDLATIHKERAITSGNFSNQEGRNFRHKKFHKSSPKD